MSHDGEESGVLSFRRLERDELDEEGEGGVEDEARFIPLLGRTYEGEWLRYVDDEGGRSAPALHVYQLIEHRDTRNRRTVKAAFMDLVPFHFDENDLCRAVDEHGDRAFPPGEYRVQLKDEKGQVVTSASVTVGGRRQQRPPARDVGDVTVARLNKERAEVAELHKAHAAELAELRKAHALEVSQLRKQLDREREEVTERRTEVMRSQFEIERRDLALEVLRGAQARAEERAAEAERLARAAEQRAVEAERRALAPADLSTVLQQLRERLARDQAALAELTGPPTGAGGKVERGQVLEEAAGGLAATMRELVSLGKTAMRGIEGAGLAGEADGLAEALARKGA